MPLEIAVAGVMLMALIAYALMGGADYGGGVWDLLASGKRAKRQRALIAEAIGPVWEANHVWLILVIVILFSGFPTAFAAITTVLHIPLTLMLIGIVLRGSAFTFRAYNVKQDAMQHRWGQIFSVASVITPVLLGMILGAIASGNVHATTKNGFAGYISPWLAPFPIAVGIFALCLFAFLAAVYLTLETDEKDLQEDFRNRAIIAGLTVGFMAALVLFLARSGAPTLSLELIRTPWAWALHLSTAVMALSAFYCLWKRRFGWARLFAVLQVSLILSGWAYAQFPFLMEPDFPLVGSAGPAITLKLLLWAVGLGALLLFPSLYYLLRVFKGGSTYPPAPLHDPD